jgi:hypothetical protein
LRQDLPTKAKMKLAGTILLVLLFLSTLAYLFFLIDPFDRRDAEFGVAAFLKASCRENSPENSRAVFSYFREHHLEVTKKNREIANQDATFRKRLRPVPVIGYTKLLPPGAMKPSKMDFDPCHVLR